jgi:hypothetical protein
MSDRPFVAPVRRVEGGFALGFETEERELLARLLGELRALLLSDDDDHDLLLDRLFPPAYPDDEEAEAEYQRLMREELVTARVASIDTVMEVLEPDATPLLTEGQTMAFMQSLNAVRLVLGSMLGIVDDDSAEHVEDGASPEHQLYGYLGWTLEWTVRALSGN